MKSWGDPEDQGSSSVDANELKEYRRLAIYRTWWTMWERGRRLRAEGGLLGYLPWPAVWLTAIGVLAIRFRITFGVWMF